MARPVLLQLRELLCAVCAGVGLGLVYDLLRPMRRGRISTALADLIFCLLEARRKAKTVQTPTVM